MTEIMADKIVSFPAVTSHIRHRDIWDLLFLRQQSDVRINPDFIRGKVSEYQIEDYEDKLSERIRSIAEIIESQDFLQQMSRFIAPATYEERLKNPEFRGYMASVVGEVLTETRDSIFGSNLDASDRFKI